MKKLNKINLNPDRVESENFHVGIELELKLECNNDEDHDDSSCGESHREGMENDGAREFLMNHNGLSRSEAANIESYFDFNTALDDYFANWSCEDEDCCYRNPGGDDMREELRSYLVNLTKNESFKVVQDGSINCGLGEIDAEVCWNYYASRETVKDNEKIFKHLSKIGASFNKSCGLHINLNNYLKVPQIDIDTSSLAFLFDFVAPSRKDSSYCNKKGMGVNEKYSMIFNQGDRLEFRFFSPTLEVEKLNHYVSLANVIYRRLAGKDAKLSKKTTNYFLAKMVMTNGLSNERAQRAIDQVNQIMEAITYAIDTTLIVNESEVA